jgi:hypothetical protein
MFYPINTRAMVRRNLTGAFADDPTIPHVPSRRRRLLRALVRTPRDSPAGDPGVVLRRGEGTPAVEPLDPAAANCGALQAGVGRVAVRAHLRGHRCGG